MLRKCGRCNQTFVRIGMDGNMKMCPTCRPNQDKKDKTRNVCQEIRSNWSNFQTLPTYKINNSEYINYDINDAGYDLNMRN